MSKTVLISGGTSGMGKASVEKLLADGFNVATFAPDAQNIDEKNFLSTIGDVTKEVSVKNIVKKTMAKFEQIDILINNAGLAYYEGVTDIEIDKFRKLLDVNIVGVALLTKEVVPHMKEKKSGLIINIVSISATPQAKTLASYRSSKYAVAGYSDSIMHELKPFGIRVTVINPGMVNTPFWYPNELERRKKLNNGKLPPMLEANDVADAISYVCSQPNNVSIEELTIVPF